MLSRHHEHDEWVYRGIMVHLPSGPKDNLNPYVFPFGILIGEGVQFTLALFYLGSLYTWLDECVGNIV